MLAKFDWRYTEALLNPTRLLVFGRLVGKLPEVFVDFLPAIDKLEFVSNYGFRHNESFPKFDNISLFLETRDYKNS